MEDNYPIVGFIAETDRVYRAVMSAASVEGGGTSFAGMVMLGYLMRARMAGGAGSDVVQPRM